MTAVAVQQHGSHRPQYNTQSSHSANMSSPQQSRPQSYTSASGQGQRQEPPLQNGNSAIMSPRPTVSNDPVQMNGTRSQATSHDRRSSTSTARIAADTGRLDRRSSIQARPTSAPHGVAESSPDDSEVEQRRRRPRLLLQRAKSDFGPRPEDLDSEDEDMQDWGARHGFEDHYASEEYVSQLANVGRSFPLRMIPSTFSYPEEGLPTYRKYRSLYDKHDSKLEAQ
jgi:regulator-associated protein of mTOR